MQVETAYLELDTYSLAGTSNINAGRTNYVFRNINLKSVMGDMWDKYEKFSIRLRSSRYTAASVAGGGSQFNLIQHNLKGLDWINCYDEKWGFSQEYMPISWKNGSAAAVSNLPSSNFCFNFRKGKQIVDLEILVTTLGTPNTAPTSGQLTLPEQVLEFIIQPADNQNEMGYFGVYTTQSATAIKYPQKIITNNGRTYTYVGLDMRNICREFWDKYTDYELILAGYQTSADTMVAADLQTPIQISGLNFYNNLTKEGSSYLSQDGIVGMIALGTSSTHYSDMNEQWSPLQFKKSGDLINFTMEWRNYDNSGLNADIPSSNARNTFFAFFIRPIKNKMDCDKATLTLSSANLTTTMTNLGVRNASYTDITLNNIDFRQACQGFWDKYSKFNIFFTGHCAYATTVPLEEVWVQLNIEGLPTEPQISILDPRQTSNTWNVGAINLYNNAVTPVPWIQSYGVTKSTMFYKTQDLITLRLYTTRLANVATPTTAQALNGTFIFTIVGVEE